MTTLNLLKNKMESLLNAVFPMTEFLLPATHHCGWSQWWEDGGCVEVFDLRDT